MTADNPYRAFVDGFRRLLTDTKPLDVAATVPPTRPPVPADAPKVLIFAPHPDDEVIIGGLPLRLLRELLSGEADAKQRERTAVDRAASEQGQRDDRDRDHADDELAPQGHPSSVDQSTRRGETYDQTHHT